MRTERPGGEILTAALLGAGLAVRALGQLGAPAESALRAGLYALAPLLYCIGFGYGLLRLVSPRHSIGLHLGAGGLIAGAVLEALGWRTPFTLALYAAGAALAMSAFWHAASRSKSGLIRIALFVVGTGPLLFALHAVVFAQGADLLQARFLRLGATAAMALPLLAGLYHLHPLAGDNRLTRIARILLGIGMVAVPLVLVLAAFVDARLKYGLGPASDCLTVAMIVACYQAWRGADRAALAGFGTVLASMLLGKVMGFYAFDGPLPSPAVLSGYADAWRVSLRHFHIDLMVLGYALLLWPTRVGPRTVAVAGLALAIGLCMPAMGAWSYWAGVATVLWLIVFWRDRLVE